MLEHRPQSGVLKRIESFGASTMLIQRTAMPSDGKAGLAVLSAHRLQSELSAQHGVPSDLHDGYGLALVSVWVGLVVWCDGERFWWLSGWDERRHRPVYAWHAALDIERAAHRIARRRQTLLSDHPLSPAIVELSSTTLSRE
ncbi:hypothetical protein ACIBG7_16300 [Nonomuraea sp. NPDC050328]|uniref:hypothetical protein n=1 Tax=Nonomuraea sp. NPDC050328 TaxID=3364361 RepID=UPI00379B3A29